MMGRTHAALGTATALGICAIDTPALLPALAFVGSSLAASKLPDKLEFNGTLPHRGPTHWLIMVPLVAFAAGVLAEMLVWTQPISSHVMAGVFVGYLMHLLADACTVSGVPLLGPFSRRDRRLLPSGFRAVTGGPRDTAVWFLATSVSVALATIMLLPLPKEGILVSDECDKPDRAVRVYLSKAKYPNIISHIKESWREGYPHVLRIHRRNADRRRARLLSWWQARHPQPKSDGLDLDEAPAAVLRSSWRASVRPVPERENRSAGAVLGNAIGGVCSGVRVMYVFTA